MKKNESTKDKLVKAGIRLFSQYGYAATSTRMLANEAGVNLSAISFHFASKEGLYTACLNYIADKINHYYEVPYKEIEEAFTREEMTKEKARYFLECLVDLQINVAFQPEYQTSLALIYWEEKGPEELKCLSKIVFEYLEKTMAELIRVMVPVPEIKAMFASRYINGSIIAFGEHRSLMESYLVITKDHKNPPDWVRSEIKKNSFAVIREMIKEAETKGGEKTK